MMLAPKPKNDRFLCERRLFRLPVSLTARYRTYMQLGKTL
jgi:hypothetical protein